ncbi:MAG: hypothetical protein K2Q14_01630 [Gammaproteobacteria bacterium]|nr:hypothetical protein [Gammaproteobacteria bacterium]
MKAVKKRLSKLISKESPISNNSNSGNESSSNILIEDLVTLNLSNDNMSHWQKTPPAPRKNEHKEEISLIVGGARQVSTKQKTEPLKSPNLDFNTNVDSIFSFFPGADSSLQPGSPQESKKIVKIPSYLNKDNNLSDASNSLNHSNYSSKNNSKNNSENDSDDDFIFKFSPIDPSLSP